MKKCLLIILAGLLLCGMTACNQEDPELTLSVSELAVLSEGASSTVTLSCTGKWTAQASAPWIHVSPISGKKGSCTLNITVEPNTGTTVRKGSVDFHCGDMSRSVRINQAQPFNQTLTLVFSGSEVQAPKIVGNSLSGEIDWGDGVKETYSADLKHSYSSSGNHTIAIKLAGGTSFSIGTSTGLSEVDFSEF